MNDPKVHGEQEALRSRLRTSGSFSNLSASIKEDSVEPTSNNDSMTYQAMLYSIMSDSGTVNPEIFGFATLPRNTPREKSDKSKRARSVPGFKGQRSKTGGNLSVMFNSMSADAPQTETSRKQISTPKPLGESIDSDYSPETEREIAGTFSRDQPINVERLLLNFSGRPISEAERKEIREHLATGIDRIRQELSEMLVYLDHRSSATPV